MLFIKAWKFITSLLVYNPFNSNDDYMSQLSHIDLLEKWESYKTKFGKAYNSTYEETMSKSIFFESWNNVANHRSKNLTYDLEINMFADMKLKTYSMDRYEQICSNFSLTSLGDSPKEIDWRNFGLVTPVKFQGFCGSCWAFSAIGSIEGQLKRKTGKLISLSEQNLIDCRWGGNCYGGNVDEDESCKFNKSLITANITSCVQLPKGDEDILMKAVSSIGPIAVNIAQTRDLYLYKTGIFNDPECKGEFPSHAVLLIGYGTDEKLGDFWIVKNSWSEEWGEAGYIRIARGQNVCAIADEAYFPII